MVIVGLMTAAYAGSLDVASGEQVESWLTPLAATCATEHGGDATSFRVQIDVTRGQPRARVQGLGATGEPTSGAGAAVNCIQRRIEAAAWAPTTGRYAGTVAPGAGDVKMQVGPNGFSFDARGAGGPDVRIDVQLPGIDADGARPPEPAAPPPRAVGPVELVLRNPDGEWAEVRLDGKVIAEFENQTEIVRKIDGGLHTLAVHEFMSDEPFFEGRLDTTGAGARIIIGIDVDDERVRAFNHDGLTATR